MQHLKIAPALLAALVIGACATERHYALEAPPPPRHEAAPTPRPAHPASAHPSNGVPPNVGSAGPLKLAMIGDYMDAQERDFRAHLRAPGVGVARIGDDLVLSVRDDILFEGNGVSEHGHNVLERAAELLRHYDHTAVQVGGYTDTSGSAAQNLLVSQERAKSVADVLVADGVAGARVSAQGYGSTHLKIATGPDKPEPRNRRIEIRVIAHPQA